MQLTLWTYEGPPHVGAMRIATAMDSLHYVLHAPQGDTYADLLFTMIERLPKRPPVTYTTFQARDLGGDTAELFKNAVREAAERFTPQAMIVGASCTAELIQDDPGGLASALNLDIPVIPLELPSYQKKENWGASETLYQIVRSLLSPVKQQHSVDVSLQVDGNTESKAKAKQVFSCNLIGPTALGFRHRDDIIEITRLLALMQVQVNVVAPQSATPQDIKRLPKADFNVLMYPEIGLTTVQWLERNFRQPFTKVVPIGLKACQAFVEEVCKLTMQAHEPILAQLASRAQWYARSVDSNYLNDKRVFIFGDATHALAAARVASKELGFKVVGLGTYSREFAREIRQAAQEYEVTPLITDDYLEVEQAIAESHCDLVLGTQMERHIAKRLGLPCAVISAPVHVQDFPARYAPQMGVEGANVLFDTWVQPLMMGLEEHLLGMFKDDFEFNEQAAPSHLGQQRERVQSSANESEPNSVPDDGAHEGAHDAVQIGISVKASDKPEQALIAWANEAQKELGKIPFFVRGKARRNTERFAVERGLHQITVDTLYEAKAHFSRS